jgi:hypothetical protein
MKRAGIIAVALVIATVACGKSNAEKQAEEAQKQATEAQKQAADAQKQAAQSTEQAAQQAAKGLEQMAKGLGGMMAGGGTDTKPVEPVSFRDMQALFPDVDGWQKAKPTGEKMSSPFSFSQAEVEYTKGDSRIQVKMVDSGFNQLLLTPYAMFLTAGYEKETADGYEKSTKVNGQPGWEKWNSASKNGELNALVGKRFLVTIEGSGIDDNKVLQDVAGKIDMGKLAALK